jgi:type II secretory pathway pseudopilin PulG
MNTRPPSPGTTLVEAIFALILLGVLAGLTVPPLRAGLDRVASAGARDALLVAVARARAVAIARGGTTLFVDVSTARYWIEAADGSRVDPPVDLAAEYGITLAVDGGGAAIALRFDGLGLGQVANRTIRVRRGEAESRLTLSSYGRPRSW